MPERCRVPWCGEQAIHSHAHVEGLPGQTKRSRGGKQTLPFCIQHDLDIDEHRMSVSHEAGILKFYRNGRYLGEGPLHPIEEMPVLPSPLPSLADQGETFRLKMLSNELLLGFLAHCITLGRESDVWTARTCYVFRTRIGHVPKWQHQLARDLRDDHGVELAPETIRVYAWAWGRIEESGFANRITELPGLQELGQTKMLMIASCDNQERAAEIALENPDASKREFGAMLQDEGLKPKAPDLVCPSCGHSGPPKEFKQRRESHARTKGDRDH